MASPRSEAMKVSISRLLLLPRGGTPDPAQKLGSFGNHPVDSLTQPPHSRWACFLLGAFLHNATPSEWMPAVPHMHGATCLHQWSPSYNIAWLQNHVARVDHGTVDVPDLCTEGESSLDAASSTLSVSCKPWVALTAVWSPVHTAPFF
jgi:hypothetical protein